MKKKGPETEMTPMALAKAAGTINALEFILSVKTDAIGREQRRVARLALDYVKHGGRLAEVFPEREEREHVMRCMVNYDAEGFRKYFPDGFALANSDSAAPKQPATGGGGWGSGGDG